MLLCSVYNDLRSDGHPSELPRDGEKEEILRMKPSRKRTLYVV